MERALGYPYPRRPGCFVFAANGAVADVVLWPQMQPDATNDGWTLENTGLHRCAVL
jgi:hypothetical protein